MTKYFSTTVMLTEGNKQEAEMNEGENVWDTCTRFRETVSRLLRYAHFFLSKGKLISHSHAGGKDLVFCNVRVLELDGLSQMSCWHPNHHYRIPPEISPPP